MKLVITLILSTILIATGVLVYRQNHSPANAMMAAVIPVPWSGNERLIPRLQDKLKDNPSSPEWNSALGHAYLQKARETGDPGYYTKADELFDRSLSSKKDYIEALVGKAALAMSRHDFEEAKAASEKAIRLNPDVVQSYGVLADALVELGEYNQAIQALDTMVRKKPNLSSYSRISYLRELHGDVEGAIQSMQMAIDSGAPDAENTAWCMVQLADLYLRNGNLAEADRQNRVALGRFPNYVHAFAGLARVSVVQKDFIAASHWYQKAIDRVPMPEFLIGLGEVYERLGKAEDAERQFELVRAIQKIYESNGVNTEFEMILFSVDHGGDVNAAIKAARKEWERRKSVKVADAYAWGLFRAGLFEEAGVMMKQALRLGTKDPLFMKHSNTILKSMN